MDDDTLGRAYRETLQEAGTHLTEEEWTALQLNELAVPDRERLLAHIVGCADCTAIHRSLLALAADASSFDPSVPLSQSSSMARSRPTWIWAAGLAAAAVLLIGIRITRTPGPDQEVVRNTSTVAAIEMTSPRSGGILANRRLEWTAVPGATQYDLRISSSDGGLVWQSQAATTTADIPLSVTMRGHYYIQITAMRDGTIVGSTSLVPFDVN